MFGQGGGKSKVESFHGYAAFFNPAPLWSGTESSSYASSGVLPSSREWGRREEENGSLLGEGVHQLDIAKFPLQPVREVSLPGLFVEDAAGFWFSPGQGTGSPAITGA